VLGRKRKRRMDGKNKLFYRKTATTERISVADIVMLAAFLPE
jgi:hypothetical protein